MTIDERLEALTLNLELTARDLEAHKDETRKRIDALHDFLLQFGERVAQFHEQVTQFRSDTQAWIRESEAWRKATEARIQALEAK
jgi:uncharacterized coiled-coil DUF342 family protein